jgi:programmed cell death 6-interacting protein
MFADDLLIIDRLREDAVNVLEPHTSGISKLVTYAAQLKWMGGKFPIDVSAWRFVEMSGRRIVLMSEL